jgi:hypothetical protein
VKNLIKLVTAILAAFALLVGFCQPVNAVTPEPETVSFSVYFKEDSTSLSASAKAILREKYSRYSTDIQNISIKGYVRSSGDGKRLIKCATSRAKNVSSYLKTLGFASSISARGIGTPPTAKLASTARRATITFTLRPVTPPPTTFTITVTSNSGGTVSPSGIAVVSQGSDSLIYTFSPDNDYSVGAITIDGVTLTGTAFFDAVHNGYKFLNVTQNHTISVEFWIWGMA